MAVNGVLEGYLTVYGWEVYAAVFLLLVAIGGVIYPVTRIVFDAAIAYGEGSSNPTSGANSLMIRLTIYSIVLVLGMIPIIPLEITSTKIQNQCAEDLLTSAFEDYKSLQNDEYGFGKIESARVPALPYLAMVLASGFNAVLYQAIPCVHDLTKLNVVSNTLDYSLAENPNALRANVAQFTEQCRGRARKIYTDFISGRHGKEGHDFMKGLMEEHADTANERHRQLVLLGSDFYKEVFFQPCSSVTGELDTPEGKLCNILPLRATKPVDGFGYDAARDTDASAYQAAHDEGLPTCLEWWEDTEHGLRQQMAKAGGISLKEAVRSLRAANCRSINKDGFEICYDDLLQKLGNPNEIEEYIVEQMQMSQKRNLTGTDTDVGILGGIVTVGLGVATFFGMSDVATSLASQAAGYFTTMFLLKIAASMFQPFLLMALFILWGVFLVIGEMRGMTMIKGMMLIFMISILPSLWSLADVIDDQLFLAMYPDAPLNPFSLRELLGDHSTIERILLDVVTTAFYIILPMLMLYLIAEAGGPSRGLTILLYT